MKKNWNSHFPLPKGKWLKSYWLMRNFIILFFALNLSAFANGLSQKVSVVQYNNATLVEVFEHLMEETGYGILYKKSEINLEIRVNLDVENTSVQEVLKKILKETNLSYEVQDEVIVIFKEKANPLPIIEAEQEKKELKGTVTDEAGNTLPGVSVVVKGTTIGVATDMDGNYSIEFENDAAVLVFSFVGMFPQEIVYKGQSFQNITFIADSEQMEEVVVTGYFNQKKESFTGSVVSVKGEELREISSNILQSFQVFDPSFRIIENNEFGSDPNQLPDIQVRGTTAFNTGNSQLSRTDLESNPNMPTFILDGYEVSLEKVFDLDMNRIESVTILKDAAATAIYGSRASNGVMVIATKSPVEGKLQISYNYELTVTSPDLTDYHLLNAAEKLEYEKLAGLYEYTGGTDFDELTRKYYQKKKNVVSGVDTYWLSQPVETALGHKHSMFIEGGSESIRYGLDLRAQNGEGVMKGSNRDRYSTGVHLSYNLNDNILIKNVLTVSKVSSEESPYGGFYDYVKMNPYYPKSDIDGKLIREVDNWERKQSNGSFVNDITLNPLYESTLNNFNDTEYTEINNAFSAEWNITSALRLRGLLSYTSKISSIDNFTSPLSNAYYFQEDDKLSERGDYFYMTDKSTTFDGNLVLTYSKSSGKHFFNYALGSNIKDHMVNRKSFRAIGFTNDRFTHIGFANKYQEGDSPSGTVWKERLMGVFTSLNYSYANKYLFDFSFRLDGSSKFGSENSFAPFWATGIGWNLHNEDFLNSSVINKLKLRFSTGLTGEVSFAPYMSKTMYEYYTDNWYSTGVGVVHKGYGNEDLKWQRTQNSNIGIDLGMFDNRIVVTSSVYYKLTKDLLSDINVPASMGFSSYKANLGEMENKGFELGLRFNVIRKKDWNLNLTANMVSNKNKIKKISDALKNYNNKVDEEQVSDENKAVPLLRYKEGQSLSTIYAVQSLGIDPENGQEIFIKADGTHTYEWNVKDIVPMGNSEPKLSGFFGGNLAYKNLMLAVNFYTKLGGDLYNQTLVDRVENADPRYNVDKRVLENRWKQPGDQALYKNIADLGTTFTSSRFIHEDNIVELKTVNLIYEAPVKYAKKIGMQRLKFAFLVNNLWRWSSNSIERGINYPFARSFTFSVQTRF